MNQSMSIFFHKKNNIYEIKVSKTLSLQHSEKTIFSKNSVFYFIKLNHKFIFF